jgi:hypothetical protein
VVSLVITVGRYDYSEDNTRGLLYAGGKFIGYTMEDPWNDNEKFESCIPNGEYKTEIRKSKDSPSRDYDHMILRDVPNRSYILWHVGNTEEHTEGCLLPGKTALEDMVGNSQKAFDELMELAKRVESIETRITDISL